MVRRGETEIYRLLKEYLEARGVVRVVWDRRDEGRSDGAGPLADGDRRPTDRRGATHDLTYRALGFFLARPGVSDEVPTVGRPRGLKRRG